MRVRYQGCSYRIKDLTAEQREMMRVDIEKAVKKEVIKKGLDIPERKSKKAKKEEAE